MFIDISWFLKDGVYFCDLFSLLFLSYFWEKAASEYVFTLPFWNQVSYIFLAENMAHHVMDFYSSFVF